MAKKRIYMVRAVGFFALTVAMYALFFWLYNVVLGLEQPMSYFLRRRNSSWATRVELMSRRMDTYQEILDQLEQRDNEVYRSVFGMNEIPSEVRDAGIGGVNRYEAFADLSDSSLLKTTAIRLDRLTKKAYIQSKSFDEVFALAVSAGDMAASVPSIPPMYPDAYIMLTSTFGYREDPVWGGAARHTGIDLATDKGNPVYATGDGVVENVSSDSRGYGIMVVIDHGFGYKTRYAHLNAAVVTEGQEVKRGDHIAYSGQTGKCTGAHLHYEVLYRNNYVNPLNYMDLDIHLADYRNMVQLVPRQKGTSARRRRR